MFFFFLNLKISCLIYYGSLFCFAFSLGPSRTQSQHNLKTLSQPQNNECPGRGGGMGLGYRGKLGLPRTLGPRRLGSFSKSSRRSLVDSTIIRTINIHIYL